MYVFFEAWGMIALLITFGMSALSSLFKGGR